MLSDRLFEFAQNLNNRKTIWLQFWTNELVTGMFTFLRESDQLAKLANRLSSEI
jgi:hypothetical protein